MWNTKITMLVLGPVSRNSSWDRVSWNQRMKPQTTGVQTRQEFIASKHELPAQGGDPNGWSPEAFCSPPCICWSPALSQIPASLTPQVCFKTRLIFRLNTCSIGNVLLCSSAISPALALILSFSACLPALLSSHPPHISSHSVARRVSYPDRILQAPCPLTAHWIVLLSRGQRSHWLARAAVTKYNRVGGLDNRNVISYHLEAPRSMCW